MLLTDNEKANILYSHIKNIEYNKYNSEVAIISEQALESFNEASVLAIRDRIESFNKQISALQSELDKLNISSETLSSFAEPTDLSPTPIVQ